MDPKGKNPQTDNQSQLHEFAVKAYSQVIRALQARSNVLTWDVENTITELRRHLEVSNEEHMKAVRAIVGRDNVCVATQAENALGAPSSSSSLRPHLMTNADVMDDDSSGVGLRNVANQVASPAFVAPSSSLRPHSVAVGVPTLELEPPPGFIPNTNIAQPAIAPPKLVKYAMLKDIMDDSPNKSQNTSIGWSLWEKDSEDNNLYEAIITGYDPIHGHQTSVHRIDRPNGTLESIEIIKVAPKDKGPAEHERSQNNESSKRGRPPKPASAKPSSSNESANIHKRVKQHPDYIELYVTVSLIEKVEKTLEEPEVDPIKFKRGIGSSDA